MHICGAVRVSTHFLRVRRNVGIQVTHVGEKSQVNSVDFLGDLSEEDVVGATKSVSNQWKL